MFRFARRYRGLTAVLVAVVACGVFAVAALADAPDATQTANYSNLGFAPNQTTVVGIVYDPAGFGGLGTTTLTVKGGWAWPTHKTDCNTDRAGAGYAIDWNDPNDAGYAIANTGVSVGSQNPHGFAANTDANVVQPTPSANDPSNPAAVRKVSTPSAYASWGGGCGKVSTGTVTGWQGGGNPPTSFSQGYWGPISHTYVGAPSALPNQVCAVTYDVHKGKTPAQQPDGLGIPGGAKEITAGGNGFNGDNSVQKNSSTPAGNMCAAILLPGVQIVKTADAPSVPAGSPIGFTLTVYNTGTAAATGVTLSDTLPTNPGLSWQIASQGGGWGGSCGISGGKLTCGPVTVAAGTTQALSTFTVHITSPTTGATGGSCPTTGVVNNTGSVTSTNAGSGQSSASTCIAAPGIQIVKMPDAAQVNAGNPIGFTLTVYNNGTGDAKDVELSDVLPAKAGLSWSIASQGTGWAGSCKITNGTLSCGKVTVSAGTTLAGSTFTVHITSPTTAATGGTCPSGSGVVDNTGTVTAKSGSGQSSASTCVLGSTDLQITKSGAPAVVGPPIGNITWTLVVTNNGPGVDTNVTVADPMPAGNTYVSSTTTKGSCTGGALLTCSLGTLQVGETVTITLVTTPTTTGVQTNVATVVGDLPETTLTNNTASATVLVAGPHTPPPKACTAVLVRPKQLFVGRSTTMHLKVTSRGRAVAGVRVRIKGPGISVVTTASNAKGKITKTIKPRKAGIVVFRPIANKSCAIPRVGVTGVIVPPVTG